jgi:hypothetical protein
MTSELNFHISLFSFVIPRLDRGIQYSGYVLNPPVKPGDDRKKKGERFRLPLEFFDLNFYRIMTFRV